MKKIGIVGLGIMGRGMAYNFLKNGYEVFVWNRTTEVSQTFLDDFDTSEVDEDKLTICDSPLEVTESADLIFEVTANDESSEAVWYGEDGIIAGASPNKILVVSATLSVEYTDKLVGDCKDKNLQILDIPLTGGRVGAETGNMTLLCGGDEDLIEELKPTFDAIAGNVFYFGPAGHGMRYKLILNFVQASHIVAFGKAMQIARSQGMDEEKVAEGLAFRPGGVITNIGKDTYFEDPDPITFSIEWINKDVNYAAQMAEAAGVELGVMSAILAQYKKAMSEGMKDRDWASIVRPEFE